MLPSLIFPYGGITPRIADSVFVAPGAAIVGDIEIGEESGIWFNVSMRGDVNSIKIGARTNIQDGSVIHVASDGPAGRKARSTVIGNDVTVGHMALIHACTIEDECLIGMRSVVMDGARVGKHSIIGAGALVTEGKQIPSRQLWMGSPARYVRDITDEEVEAIRHSARQYADHAALYKSKVVTI